MTHSEKKQTDTDRKVRERGGGNQRDREGALRSKQMDDKPLPV